MNKAMTRALIGIWAPLLLATGAVAGEKTPDARPGDPMASCAQMMHDPGCPEPTTRQPARSAFAARRLTSASSR